MNQALINSSHRSEPIQHSEILSTLLGRHYRKRILICISLIGTLVSLCYSALLWTQYQMIFSSVTDFLYALCYVAILYWIRQEKLIFAAYWSILVASLQVTLGSIFFVGAETGFQLYFLSLPVLVYFLLNDQDKWKKIGVMIYGCLCFIAGHILRFEMFMAPISTELAQVIFIGNVLIVFLIIISAVKFFSDEVLSAYQQQSKLVLTDALTGLANYRFVQQYASKLLSQADRYGHPVSLIHFDIDHFRQINVEHSHTSGDQCLTSVTLLIKDDIRDADILARIGGDEFVIILPKTSAEDAKQLVARLKQTIDQHTVELSEGPLKVSASFGLSSCDSSDMKSIEELITEAQT